MLQTLSVQLIHFFSIIFLFHYYFQLSISITFFQNLINTNKVRDKLLTRVRTISKTAQCSRKCINKFKLTVFSLYKLWFVYCFPWQKLITNIGKQKISPHESLDNICNSLLEIKCNKSNTYSRSYHSHKSCRLINSWTIIFKHYLLNLCKSVTIFI